MVATAQKPPVLTTADGFLASTTRLGPGKHQLIDGVNVAMAQASPTHATIQARLGYLIATHLNARKLPCRVMTEAGVTPRVRGRTNIRVPDLLVTCGPPPQPGDGLVHEPIVIFEVLSPSNDDETESSVMSCASIPSVQEMLVFDRSRLVAEVWLRDAGGAWPTEPETVTTGSMRLDSIEFHLAPSHIYAGTHLAVS
jgi:Uma2 family endonuclease